MKKSLFWLLAAALQFYKVISYFKLIKYYKKIFEKLKDLSILSVSELSSQTFGKIYNTGDYVLCQGRLSASEVCRSRIDPNMRIVYSELVMEKIMEIGNKTSQVKRIIEKIRPSFLNMSDGKSNLKIFETGFTRMITTTVRRRITRIKQKLFQFSWFLSIFSKLPLPTKLISIKYIESSIVENTMNVVFAKICKNKKGEIYFSRPKAIGPLKQAILQSYANSINYYTVCYYLVGMLLVITCALYYKYEGKSSIKDYLKKQNNQCLLDNYKKISVQDRTCLRCQEKISTLINHPCGHLNVCEECGKDLQKCNECKKKPKQQIIIYSP